MLMLPALMAAGPVTCQMTEDRPRLGTRDWVEKFLGEKIITVDMLSTTVPRGSSNPIIVKMESGKQYIYHEARLSSAQAKKSFLHDVAVLNQLSEGAPVPLITSCALSDKYGTIFRRISPRNARLTVEKLAGMTGAQRAQLYLRIGILMVAIKRAGALTGSMAFSDVLLEGDDVENATFLPLMDFAPLTGSTGTAEQRTEAKEMYISFVSACERRFKHANPKPSAEKTLPKAIYALVDTMSELNLTLEQTVKSLAKVLSKK